MSTIAVVDYGLCNIDSVVRALEECGGSAVVTHTKEDIERAARIVIPGVGSFCDAMGNLHENGLIDVLRDAALKRKVPFLGICLGMQLLATTGTEGGKSEGLGLIEGEVVLMERDSPQTRIPHVGWNEVKVARSSPLLEGVPDGSDFYFVHSYHLRPVREEDVIARTPYCGGFASVVGRENVFGAQFHPEKSQTMGFRLLKNFLALPLP